MHTAGLERTDGGYPLRLLSYNIQTGIASERYRHYVTHGWKHLLPYANRWDNLDRIARGLRSFDIVGLQEVDSGSLRTGFVNQIKYLADGGNFPFWYHQVNRRFGKFAQHSNGLLSRLHPYERADHKLPGLRGRGAMVAHFGVEGESLALIVMHLALGKLSRLRQIGYLTELVNEYPYVIVMGDMNCEVRSYEMKHLLRATHLRLPSEELSTFPSWRPRRHIDHILVTPNLHVERTYIPDWSFSDHLPIAMEVVIPNQVRLSA